MVDLILELIVHTSRPCILIVDIDTYSPMTEPGVATDSLFIEAYWALPKNRAAGRLSGRHTIVAEIGDDMSRFLIDKHLTTSRLHLSVCLWTVCQTIIHWLLLIDGS